MQASEPCVGVGDGVVLVLCVNKFRLGICKSAVSVGMGSFVPFPLGMCKRTPRHCVLVRSELFFCWVK